MGISISTVSRALKDHPNISEGTKNKVKELAAVMEYEPDNYAIQLRTQKSNLLGIMLSTIENFFYDSFIAAVEEEARRFGYSVMIRQSRDDVAIENANLDIHTSSPKTKIAVDYPENSDMSKKVAIAALTSAKPPDVIFCMGDLILIGVMKAINEPDLKVPGDIALIGISNGFVPAMCKPVVNYVETSGFKSGKLAFAQMLARLKNEVTPEIVCLESMLVKAGSL